MKSAAPRKKTRSKKAAPPSLPINEIVAIGETDDGYSFVGLARGRGAHRRYWWHCGACWQDSADTPSTSLDDIDYDFGDHKPLCPAAPYRAQITIVWADGHPPTHVRV